jgi:hypothetical protein
VFFRLPLILSIIVLAASAAECCTIPVFRYALDRWEADKFHLVLPSSASQDVALQDLLRPLRANGKANMDITTSRDPAVTVAELRSSRDSGQRLWTGALEADSLQMLLDSPTRRQFLEHILAGDSAVWIIADNGSAADMAEAERIEKRLKFLEQVAALPIQDPNDPDSQLGPGPPLKLKFTTLRVRRDDPAEKLLLKMLAGPKGVVDPETTSFAAVAFGRGRVLGAWPLVLLDDASLEDACMFLVGRCGCRLKNESPGWDILMNVDWPQVLADAGRASPTASAADPAIKVAPMAASSAKAPPEVVRIEAKVEVPEEGKSRIGVQGAVAGGLAAVAVIGWLFRRK